MSSTPPAPDSGRSRIWTALLILTLFAAILYMATVKACSRWQGDIQAPIISAHHKRPIHLPAPAVSTAPVAAQPEFNPEEMVLKPQFEPEIIKPAPKPKPRSKPKPAPKPPTVAKASPPKRRKKRRVAASAPGKAVRPNPSLSSSANPAPAAHGDQLIIEWQNDASSSAPAATTEDHKLLIEWQKEQ